MNQTYNTINLEDPDQLYLWKIGHIAALCAITLSICGSTFIIFSFLKFRSLLKNFRNRLIFYMSINDNLFSILHFCTHMYFLTNTTMGFPGQPGEWVCQFDGFIIHSLLASTCSWVLFISYYLFKRVVLELKGHQKDYIIMIIVWGSNFILALIILIFPHMAPRILWCSVNFNTGLEWLLPTFIIPCIGVFIVITVSYLVVIKKIRTKLQNKLVNTLAYYPMGYIYQWLFTCITVLIVTINYNTWFFGITRNKSKNNRNRFV